MSIICESNVTKRIFLRTVNYTDSDVCYLKKVNQPNLDDKKT